MDPIDRPRLSDADIAYARRLGMARHRRAEQRARRLGHDRDDFAQIACLALVTAARTHDGRNGCTLGTYAHRRIVWALVDAMRRDQPEACDDLDPAWDDDATEAVDLADLMESLDPETRGLVIAHAAEGRRLADLAAERGVSTSTVSRRYHGGLRRLRALAS